MEKCSLWMQDRMFFANFMHKLQVFIGQAYTTYFKVKSLILETICLSHVAIGMHIL